MKKVLLLLPILASIAGAQMQPLLRANSSTGQSCAFPGGVTSGWILIVAADTDSAGGGTLTGISDTVSTSYGSAVESSTANSMTTRVWVGVAGGTGANTATVTGTVSFNNIQCLAIDPNLYSSTVDVHTNGGYTGTPATVTSGSITPSVDQDFFYMFVAGFKSAGFLQPVSPLLWSGFFNGNDSSGGGYKITGTSGSGVTATFNNATNTQGNYVVITLKPAAMQIPISSLPTGSLGNVYSYTLPAMGGVGAYTWSITSGTLPYGLSLNTSTGAITGTPTSGPTTNAITFQVSDGTHTATASLTLTINASEDTASFINGAASGSGSTIGLTVTAGDVILVSIRQTSQSVSPPTGTLGFAYKFLAATPPNGNGTTWLAELSVFAALATSSGSETITCPVLPCVATQFRNVQPFFDVSVLTIGSSTATSTITSSNLTTLVANSMVYASAAVYTSGNTVSIAAVSPFTLDGYQGLSGTHIGAEYNVESSVGTYAPAFTQTNNTGLLWDIAALALRPSTSATIKSPSRVSSQIY